jgi:periplasmic protein CpxP/Spy
MKSTIKTWLIAGMVMVMGVAQAQHKAKLSPEEKAAKATARMEKELGLSADQKEAVHAAHLELANSMQAAREAKDKEAGKTARKTYHESLKGILSPEQMARYKEIRKAAAEKRRAAREANQKEKDASEEDFELD